MFQFHELSFLTASHFGYHFQLVRCTLNRGRNFRYGILKVLIFIIL